VLSKPEQYDKIWQLEFRCESCCLYGSHNIILDVGEQAATASHSGRSSSFEQLLHLASCRTSMSCACAACCYMNHLCTMYKTKTGSDSAIPPCCIVVPAEPAPAGNLSAAPKAKQASKPAAAEKRPRSAGDHY
jgi:hypothetical protein